MDLDLESVGARTPSRGASVPASTRTRSLSDSGDPKPKLSPAPNIISRYGSKDDSDIIDIPQPATPNRSKLRGLTLQTESHHQFTPPSAAATANSNTNKAVPLSPKLDHSQIYASPTNILPRRSRGLDFSRAATSLHHSTLAESSPESSPSVGGRGINIPGRRGGYGGPEQTSTSLWSIMGNQEKMTISSSLGSTQAMGSDSSSSSDDDMDEDMDEPYVTTPQISRNGPVAGFPFGSPAMGSPASFQHRQRQRKHQKKKRGPLGLGFNMTAANLSKSPPANNSRTRRESISWQANQLHISAVDGEDTSRSLSDVDGPPGEGQGSVIRRVMTRRANLMPKSKNFARIRAALMEEGAPADAETRREAEVVKQVRDSDVGPESSTNLDLSSVTNALSSPSLTNNLPLDEDLDDNIMGDLSMGFSSSFKQQAVKNSKGKAFWDTFSECSSVGGGRGSPPPAPFFPRGSESGISEDNAMDSPSTAGQSSTVQSQNNSIGPQPPTAAEITRRINTKRRREDDFDPASFKRRAVSPGMSVHNSPIVQSPMQRDNVAWGSGSRPGSNGADRAGSSAQSDSGSGTPAIAPGTGKPNNQKGRIGFQGMSDTNDGVMRMSIE